MRVVMVLGCVLLGGCATFFGTETTPEDEEKEVSVVYDYEFPLPPLRWGAEYMDTTRHGAAMTQGSRQHVLHYQTAAARPTPPTVPPAEAPPEETEPEVAEEATEEDEVVEDEDPAEPEPEERDEPAPSAEEDFSEREILAWERYCDGGRDMSTQDWEIVRDQGAPKNIPDFIDSCLHPK